mmetsp:Transcript_16878/g.30243  ORF Transcript_16878/g.30243 Transcript_16878/m.30243 type:complete len:399 (+) Transcript_16878:186-1382(+)
MSLSQKRTICWVLIAGLLPVKEAAPEPGIVNARQHLNLRLTGGLKSRTSSSRLTLTRPAKHHWAHLNQGRVVRSGSSNLGNNDKCSNSIENPKQTLEYNRRQPHHIYRSSTATGTTAGRSAADKLKTMMARRVFLGGVFLGGGSVVGSRAAMSRPKQDHPSKDDVESLFSASYEWDSDLADPSGEDMARLDETDDQNFYDSPKFTEHIDKVAVGALTKFQIDRIQRLANKLSKSEAQVDILDTCSSWVSHLGDIRRDTVVGVGMNMEELKANPVLTDRLFQDFNKNTKLPFPDGSFDAVLCQLSIDYLTSPVQFIKEAFRVLRPGGELIITFSNRLFFSKAVALWTGKSDLEHLEQVGSYMHFSEADLEKIRAYDILPNSMKSGGDPLYAVVGSKSIA